MRLKTLALKDRGLFREFLSLRQHELAVYAFTNIYLWKGIFRIYWGIIGDCLCVFFKDNSGCFLYFPPLGKEVAPAVIDETFRVMDRFNKNRDISRIENVAEDELAFYRSLGYACSEKPGDYLCLRSGLAVLRGDALKHKRASVNYFLKHYAFEYLTFSSRQHKKGCLELYHHWMRERKAHNPDRLYQGMLDDSLRCLEVLLDGYSGLDTIGRVVKVGHEIRAFTFGFRINAQTFCILYEITDLSVKGLSQFIFREFCRELTDYKYINIMDDSGLKNLAKVKLSYRPLRLIPAYIASRRNDA